MEQVKKVKFITDGTPKGTHVYMDDKELKNILSLGFDMSAGNNGVLYLEVFNPEVIIEGNCKLTEEKYEFLEECEEGEE